jgi:hypothetical protein
MSDLLHYVLFTALGAVMTLLVQLLIGWRREVREFAEQVRRDAEWDRENRSGGGCRPPTRAVPSG